MHIAEVRIAADDDFGSILMDMRLWLDEHRFEPSTFTYTDLNPGMSVEVSFEVHDEAEAFAKRFGGSLDSAARQVQRSGDPPVAGGAFVLQAQDLSYASHRHSLGWHRSPARRS